MSVAAVRDYLKQFHLEERVEEFTESSATVELAAAAAGVSPAEIAKTMSFRAGDGAVLVVTAGDKKIDNRKFKDRFAAKPKMLSPEEVVEFTGHEIGGVCPFAIDHEGTKAYLDVSLKRFGRVLPAAGSSNSCVRITPDELFVSARAVDWVDVCKDMAPAGEQALDG